MDIRLLGPVEVRRDGGDAGLGGEQQRSVLAALALRPGRVVSAARLIHLLWGESPADCAGTTLRWHVHRLRQALGAAVVTRKPGYLLRPDAARVDAADFEAHLAAARGAAPEQAAVRLREGLGLWRGPALADVRGLEAEAAELEERRLAALELCVDAELTLGRHAELVAELSGLLAAQPLRERTRAQLMVALHRCGRRAEALTVFRDGRLQLVEELGVEPGEELQRVHREVLAGASGAPPVPGAAMPPPLIGCTQLPADIGDFTGRRDQLAEVVRRLRAEPAAPRSVVVSGPAGVGKTTLAVHAAHLLRDAYPDGQLFVNLRGCGPAPAEPAAVLGRFLRYLGVQPGAVPEDPEERQELYRAVLARRRVLVVLDNAATESQADELLPGGPGCGVLVTSRRRLALPGARPLDLATLDGREAVAFLSGLVGDDRVTAEPEFAGRLAAHCGHLPLALRIAAARLVVRPHWTVRDLAERMADERHRLDELAHGDLEVRASVRLGHRFLDPAAARAFTLLGLLHTPDFAPWPVAALLGTLPSGAEEVLDRLADARLVEVASRDGAGQSRYRCHDLVRLYARERAGALPAAERREALGRLFAAALWLTRRTAEATGHVDRTAFQGTGPTWPMPAVLGSGPRAWLDAEWPVLTALVGHAAALGMAGAAWELTAALTPGLEARAQFGELELCAERALAASRAGGDRLGEAVALRTLARAYGGTGRSTEGERCRQDSLTILRELGLEGQPTSFTSAAAGSSTRARNSRVR
nr:AfsR/SARP family transcriptional regulator [Streptomyces coryli]